MNGPGIFRELTGDFPDIVQKCSPFLINGKDRKIAAGDIYKKA
ncbi:hypothetical protein CLOBOL_00260 [Enterocloster bolteae ATCC BAA-613]|uniref:Uncharacterized protein n=1 Tax=Enterocloster bolteae (strain ATCC BAA-613 / DSM 15670 / CCUG 46953 / JCM 12243 / WAL 16351) TaxID=411902 RepID=A8RGY3_ENTBW|nr:hypothetical protein CLOBOL_00260 [Enterocloster bolteae ATCC BAA-613]